MARVVSSKQNDAQCKPIPPDGGWGYVITVSLIIMMYVSLVPWTSFGLYYGAYLATIGDETSATSLMSSILLAVLNFTGFASSFLLKNYSIRMVGIIGAISYSVGAFSEYFAKNLFHFIICHSFFKGFGYGLMQPASLTALNSYFDKKLNLMMGISQVIISIGTIIYPPVITYVMKHVEFRNVLLVLAGLSLLNFPAIATFLPVDRFLQEELTETPRMLVTEQVPGDHSKMLEEPLLQDNGNVLSNVANYQQRNEESSTIFVVKNWLLDTIGLKLLGDLRYLNIAIGLAISFSSDYSFTVILRMILNNLDFSSNNIAVATMIYFCCDLIARIFYSVLSLFCTINNRNMFLVATFFSAMFRIAFNLGEDYSWKLGMLGLMGFSRGFIHTPLPLVVSELYKNNFSTAFSLVMVTTGCFGLLFGFLIKLVKTLTESDAMVIYLLAGTNFIACFLWIMENIYSRLTHKISQPKLKS